MVFVVLSDAAVADSFAASDAEVGVGFPVVCLAVAYPRVVRREAAEEIVIAPTLGEGEGGVEFREVVQGVKLEAVLAEKCGAA